MTSATSWNCWRRRKAWRNEISADKLVKLDYLPAMSKAEILQELPKLTKEERYEIRVKLAEMDSDGWLDEDDPLTDQEKP